MIRTFKLLGGGQLVGTFTFNNQQMTVRFTDAFSDTQWTADWSLERAFLAFFVLGSTTVFQGNFS